ncbi:asparaginase [Brachybacterium sp. GCM10030252]|uniref:asparaginase n=1 Tax=Brachybacterium sp. GCM10030252 TaxID=3273380 RepID=UPI00361EF734
MNSVSLLSLGGTIFMSQDAAGLGAAPDGTAGASLAPSVIDSVAVTHREITNVGSPSVRPEHLRDVLRNAREAIEQGATGVVVSHGTDTLEESAFLLNLYWDRDAPLVLTGAMRPSNAPGADGPANIRDAVRTAVAPSARGLGVLAVFDASVHLADQVTKTSSRSIDAFSSEPSGPVALVGEHDVRLLYRPLERPAARDGQLPAKLPNVPILMGGVGEDLTLLDGLPAGTLDGLVVAGVGMGHVAADAVPRLAALVEAGTPVVVATRIPSGGTSDRHYDYPGSEKDLISRGVVMAGALSPQKARLLLQVLITTGAIAKRIREAFAGYAY